MYKVAWFLTLINCRTFCSICSLCLTICTKLSLLERLAPLIKYFRERLNHKNVTPEKVAKSFEGTEDFFVSLGKAYLLEAAMEFFGMNDLNDSPVKHKPPNGILHLPKTRKKAYFDEVIGSFVDEFVKADPDRDAVMQNQELQQRFRQVATVDHDHDYFGVLPANGVEEGNVDDEVIEEDLSGTDKVRSANFNL